MADEGVELGEALKAMTRGVNDFVDAFQEPRRRKSSIYDPNEAKNIQNKKEIARRQAVVDEQMKELTAAEDEKGIDSFQRLVLRSVARLEALKEFILGDVRYELSDFTNIQFEELFVEQLRNYYKMLGIVSNDEEDVETDTVRIKKRTPHRTPGIRGSSTYRPPIIDEMKQMIEQEREYTLLCGFSFYSEEYDKSHKCVLESEHNEGHICKCGSKFPNVNIEGINGNTAQDQKKGSKEKG